MEKTLIEDLKALAQVTPGDARHSKTARLRAHLPLVEQALGTGATHAAVLEILKAHGLVMTPGVFSATLRRLRQAKKTVSPIADVPLPTPAPPLPSHRSPQPTFSELHDPSTHVDMDSLINQGKRKQS